MDQRPHAAANRRFICAATLELWHVGFHHLYIRELRRKTWRRGRVARKGLRGLQILVNAFPALFPCREFGIPTALAVGTVRRSVSEYAV